MVSQFTIHMLVPICICSYLGFLLDEKLNTSFCFVFLFFLGALAGGRNVYLLALKISEDKDKRPSELYGSNVNKKGKSSKEDE